MAIEWHSGNNGMRRAEWVRGKERHFIVSNGKAALSLEVGGSVSMVIHLPFPVRNDSITDAYPPNKCEYVEGGCYGDSWYSWAAEIWKEHGSTLALWTALEDILARQFADYEREWSHKRRCSHCSGKGVVEGQP